MTELSTAAGFGEGRGGKGSERKGKGRQGRGGNGRERGLLLSALEAAMSVCAEAAQKAPFYSKYCYSEKKTGFPSLPMDACTSLVTWTTRFAQMKHVLLCVGFAAGRKHCAGKPHLAEGPRVAALLSENHCALCNRRQ